MRVPSYASGLAVLALAAALPACSAHKAWLVPVGSPLAALAAREPSCAVDVEDLPEPGTKPLALVHCSDGVIGTSCQTLMREKACEAGGDILFGTHFDPSGDLVATVGKLSAESVSERLMTRGTH